MNNKKISGFTIVELLVVIVVIGILAAITIVSYTGVTNKANIAAIQSDLENASKQLKLYYTMYGYYPTTLNGSYCPTAPTADNNYCLKSSSGDVLEYTSVASSTFRLSATNGSNSYAINSNSAPYIATTSSSSSTGSTCPTGYIPVPGSGTYGTSDFCVMKYEAKNVGGVATSQASGAVWASISQTNAVSTASAACTGCHLISEAEWLTIAQNVLSVASNWSTGTVGAGYIYSGHNDNSPANSIEASSNDADGYYNTGDSSGNQKRTLTLTNGEIIWDISGNVREWISYTFTGGQPGNIGGGYNWRQWNSVTTHGSLYPDPYPATTGISGASSWNSSNGVGQVYSSADDSTTSTAPYNGGNWSNTVNAGVLASSMGGDIVTFTNANTGFRVAK